MQDGLLGSVVVFLIAVTAVYVLVSREWRWSIAALGLLYFFAFLLITPSWPLELAAVKLVAGWIAASILGLPRLNLPDGSTETLMSLPPGRTFRILAASLVILIVFGAAPRLAGWTQAIGINQAWGGLLLIGLALMQLGLRSGFFRAAIGLLMLFAGFEIVYAAVESSTLVTGLLAAVNLGIALVASYLMVAPNAEAGS
jgi:hypothetical protein